MGGEAGNCAASIGQASPDVQASFSTMRMIVSVGWSIYPLGYFFGYFMGAVNADTLNLVYNLADFVNKIGFCLAIWQSAKNSTLREKDKLSWHEAKQLRSLLFLSILCDCWPVYGQFGLFTFLFVTRQGQVIPPDNL